MKNLLSLFAFSLSLSAIGQYSNYYKVDQNVNHSGSVTVNQNVEVSGKVTKTIKTIDYGALAQANAMKEQNRLESLQYTDERSRYQALEIASDPTKAFTYGEDNVWRVGFAYPGMVRVTRKNRNRARAKGLKRFIYYHKIPNTALFTSMGGYAYRNEDVDGVITELEIDFAGYIPGINESRSDDYYLTEYIGETEKYVKMLAKPYTDDDGNRWWTSDMKKRLHKTEISKARVFGEEGFVLTIVYEDDYEIVIEDRYYAITKGGFSFSGKARYRANKNEVDFSQLEGRRYYLKRLCNQVIASAKISNIGY
jgi:hypothetical protein